MKLRSKKTGEIIEACEIMIDEPSVKVMGIDSVNRKGCYKSIAELNEEWEDYKPAEPLIKDEKIRKAVRAWAEVNDYKKCIVRVYDYDSRGICFKKGVTSFLSCETRLGITFLNIDINIKTEEPYTITELCGEEEE